MEPLVGNRIVLRRYVVDDCQFIYNWRRDRETTLWMGRKFRTSISLDEVRENVLQIIERPPVNGAFFVIADKETSRYIGGIDLTDIDPEDKNAVLSMVIGNEMDRGKGYAYEAIGLLMSFAFSEMKLHKISLNVFEENKPAFRLYERSGFRIEGKARDYMLINGTYHDLVQMGILESEYFANK